MARTTVYNTLLCILHILPAYYASPSRNMRSSIQGAPFVSLLFIMWAVLGAKVSVSYTGCDDDGGRSARNNVTRIMLRALSR
jgi:hypothetical protein